MRMLLFVGIAAVGGWFAWNNVPGLKDETLALISPRIKEAKLLTTLESHLGTIEENAKALTTTASGVNRAKLIERNQQLIEESKALIQSISELNSGDAGVIRSGISTLANMVFGAPASPTPSPTAAPAPAVACPTPSS